MILVRLNKALRCGSVTQLKQLGGVRKFSVFDKKNLSKDQPRTDEEWLKAKHFSEIPGPSRFQMIRDFLPGGECHNLNFVEMNRVMRKRYGDTYRFKGMLGRPESIFTHSAVDCETTFRTEGVWPVRMTLETIKYYRRVKRPEVFKGNTGLVTEQGEPWATMRNKVNPVMGKAKNVLLCLPAVDNIAQEFVDRMERLRDPATGMSRNNFQAEIKMWVFETVAYLALDSRLGLLQDKDNPDAFKLVKSMSELLKYSFIYDVLPSFWRLIETPGFKRLVRAQDTLTDISIKYIDAAMMRNEGKQNTNSLLDQLCRIDRQVAIVMAIDILLGGVDTTSSVFLTALYHMAANPGKQEILRKELVAAIPDNNAPFTEQNTKNLPYLRACFKESQRCSPTVPVNSRISGKDIVLSGYRIPKGIGVHMNNSDLTHTEKYFPRCNEFLPERWLKTAEKDGLKTKYSTAFAYLPFGFGPRSCIGKRIAAVENEALMMRILRKYRVTWESNEEMKYISNLIMHPSGPMNFKFEPIN